MGYDGGESYLEMTATEMSKMTKISRPAILRRIEPYLDAVRIKSNRARYFEVSRALPLIYQVSKDTQESVKDELAKKQLEKLTFELDVKKAMYEDADDVEQAWTEVASRIKSKLLQFESMLAKDVIGIKTEAEAMTILKKHIKRVLNELELFEAINEDSE